MVGFREAEALTNTEILELQCDVLLPAALENVLCAPNAASVKAKLIIEGASGPTIPGADQTLGDNGILVVSDVLANADGVVISYFEWVQGL